MKAHEFSKLLAALGAVAEDGRDDRAAAWAALAAFFDARGGASVAAVFAKLSDVTAEGASRGAAGGASGARVSALLEDRAAIEALAAAAFRPAAATDLMRLYGWLETRRDARVPALLEASETALSAAPKRKAPARAPVDTAVVTSYNKRLEEALGDDPGFGAVVETMLADPAVDAAHQKAIARAFTGASGRSAKEAVARIRERHLSLVGYRANIDAVGGKSAA